MLNKTILRNLERYQKATRDLDDLNCSLIDIRYTWASQRVEARAIDLAESLERYVKRSVK